MEGLSCNELINKAADTFVGKAGAAGCPGGIYRMDGEQASECKTDDRAVRGMPGIRI